MNGEQKKKNCFSKETPTEEKFEKNVWNVSIICGITAKMI